jgi:hypothetical protein
LCLLSGGRVKSRIYKYISVGLNNDRKWVWSVEYYDGVG